tara:strand:+ start:8317 stop:9036 length:720 start_codon:yes stop_codon:yes gene_type:complete
MRKIFTALFFFVFFISLISASLPTCLDTNSQDVSKIPCVGFTVPIECSENVTVFNATNPNINFSFETFVFTDNIYNFTLDLERGNYELVDCENNTALLFIGRVEQGYGINLFGIIFPSMVLSIITLFISGRMFSRFRDDDEENEEHLREENDTDSFIPKSRLMPIVFMLFSFIPIIFMTGFVNGHLEEYLPSSSITTVYGLYYVLFSILFYFVFLVSILVWLSSFIKMRRVMRGLDDID